MILDRILEKKERGLTIMNEINQNSLQGYQEIVPQQADSQHTASQGQVVSVETSIIQVSVLPAMKETSTFQEVLQEIPVVVQTATQLLQDYRNDKDTFLETVDEKELDVQLKRMSNVTSFVKEIEESKKAIRRYFDDLKGKAIDYVDERLTQAQYGELQKAEQDIKQLKKDLESERRAKRWEEVRPTFEANINRYPLIAQYAPELGDFNKFKLIHSKLISGAKTRKVTQKTHTFINDEIHAWNTALELIHYNQWGLSPMSLATLLNMFKQNPSVELVTTEAVRLKQQEEAQRKAQEEAERRRKEEEARRERERQEHERKMRELQEQQRLAQQQQDAFLQQQLAKQQAELQRQAEQQVEAERKRREEFEQFGGQYRTIFKQSFPMFIEYLFQNRQYHDVHSNPTTKASVIYDIMHQVDYDNSIVVQETGRDPIKILDLIRFIMDA